MFSFVSIFTASAMRNGRPPRENPNTRMRFGPMRFCTAADHLRSPTVSSAPVVIAKPSIRIRMLTMAAPYEGGHPCPAKTDARPATAQ